MRFVYLEAGSGANKPVPPEMISAVSEAVDIPIIVGGGIRKGEELFKAVKAGAKLIVTGTLVEGHGPVSLKELIEGIRKTGSSIQLRGPKT